MNGNTKLAAVVANAKKAGFPKASIEAAIVRGQGRSPSGAALENLTIEAMIPPSVATIIECQTDSKLKTLQDVRQLVAKFGGTVTPTTHMFERRGRIVFEKSEGVGSHEVLEEAIEAGATDVDEEEDGRVVVYTSPSSTKSAADQLTDLLGVKVESSDIIWDPDENQKVTIDSEAGAENVQSFLGRLVALEYAAPSTDLQDHLQEEPTVQGVYVNANFLDTEAKPS